MNKYNTINAVRIQSRADINHAVCIVDRLQPLDEIAKEENWVALGTALMMAMPRHEDYGLPNPQAVLRVVARIRDRQPMTLNHILSSVLFLKEHAPQIFEEKPESLPLARVRQLETLMKLNWERAERIKDDALRNIRARLDLSGEIDAARAALARNQRRMGKAGYENPAAKAKRFRRLVEAYLKVYAEDLIREHDITVESGQNLLPPCDLQISQDGRCRVAVEARPARLNVQDRHLYELLGLCLLRSRSVPENWIIFEDGWQDHVERLCEIARTLEIYNLKFACLTLEDAPREADVTWFDPMKQGSAEITPFVGNVG